MGSCCTCPGIKKDVIACDKKKGKAKRQKHFMLTTLQEAHSSVKAETPCCRICFSKFCDLRPPDVKLVHNS